MDPTRRAGRTPLLADGDDLSTLQLVGKQSLAILPEDWRLRTSVVEKGLPSSKIGDPAALEP